MGPNPLASRIYQWVASHKSGKTAEVAIRRPQLSHTLEETDRPDAGIVHFRANDASLLDGVFQMRPITFGFSNQTQTGRLDPSFDLIQSSRKRR